jgi:hypothetical protein
VTFATRVRLSTSATSTTPPRFAGAGAYTGVYVAPLRGSTPGSGTLLLRGLPLLSDVHFPLGPQSWLPPGRYRVHLLGDAPATVRVRVEGLPRDVTVRTARPSPVVAALTRRGVAGVDAPADRTVVPLTVRSTTLTVVASAHESTAFLGRREVCVRRRTDGLSPCLDGNAGRGWYYSVVPFRWGLAGAAVYHPGALPVGDAEVEYLDVTAGAPAGLHSFTMMLN